MKGQTTVQCPCCPNRCTVTVDEASGTVTGNRCDNGARFARSRLSPANGMREVRGELRVSGGAADRVRFRLDREVSAEQLPAIGEALKSLRVTAPVHAGDILAVNLAGTGAMVIADGTVR